MKDYALALLSGLVVYFVYGHFNGFPGRSLEHTVTTSIGGRILSSVTTTNRDWVIIRWETNLTKHGFEYVGTCVTNKLW